MRWMFALATALVTAAYATTALCQAPSEWRSTSEVNKLDDTKRLTLGMVSLGPKGEQGFFVIRCFGSSLDAIVAWPANLGRDDPQEVRWKIDDGPLQVERWSKP
jgi:hypothetical protein